MLNIKTFQFNPLQECSSVVWDDTKEAAIIDPGFYDETEAQELYSFISDNSLTPKMILLTHGHFDHIFGVRECAEKYGIPVYMNDADKIILEVNRQFTSMFGLKDADPDFSTTNINDGDKIQLGNAVFEVITTPGHTPGGVCFYDAADKVMFTGDTLFAGTIGRTDNAWGDYDKLIVAVMEKLMGLDSDVRIFPGHGHGSTIGYERTHNPFLQPFNEPDAETLDWDQEGISIKGGDGTE